MNEKVCRIILVIFLVPILYAPINAEEILTIEKAISIAYENNPGMIEARKIIEMAKGDLITAKTLLNPEVEFEIGGLKKNEAGERKTNLDNIEIRQGFDPPGVRGLKSNIARNEILIQEESLRSAWSGVYLEVRQTYARIILDKKESELANDNLNILRQFFSRVQIRFQSGQVLKNELQRAKIELLRAENFYLIAEKELKTDKARLNLFLGRSMDVLFDIEEELKEEGLKLNLQELTDMAFSKRPDIKTEELQLDLRKQSLAKEELGRLPSTFIGFQRTNEDYEDDYSVVLGMSLPFWNWNQGEVKKAKAQKEAQEVKLEATKREVVFDVYGAYLNAELTQKQLDLFKESLEEANELLRLANLRYSEGEIDFINYLDQVRTATETRVRYYEGLFSLNQAISELEKTIYSSVREEDFLK